MSNKLVLVDKAEIESPDDFQSIGKVIVADIQHGRFKPDDKLADKFMALIPQAEVAELDAFLFSVAKIVDSIDWGAIYRAKQTETIQPIDLRHHRNLKMVEDLKVEFGFMGERENTVSRYKEYIYNRFGIEPLEKNNPLSVSVSNSVSKDRVEAGKNEISLPEKPTWEVGDFFVKIFETILRTKGITDGLAFAYADHSWSWKVGEFEVASQGEIQKQSYEAVKNALEERQILVWEKEVKKDQPSDIISLARLLELRNKEGSDTDDICIAILRAIPNATYDDLTELNSTDFWVWSLDMRDVIIEFMDDDGEYKDFMEAYIHEVHKSYKPDIIGSFGNFFFSFYDDDDLVKKAPPEDLFNASCADSIESIPYRLFLTGKAFLYNGRPIEALYCFKKSLIDNLFCSNEKGEEGLELTYPDIEVIVDATEKTAAYEDMIKFSSVFPALAYDEGWPINIQFLKHVELLNTKLSYKHELNNKYGLNKKIYDELLRTQEYALGSYEQALQIHDKTDFLLRQQMASLKQSEIILSVIQEGDEKILKAIDASADKIIDRVHNETLKTWTDKSLVHSSEEFYKGYFNEELWNKLDGMTQKYLCIAHYLYTHIAKGRNSRLEEIAKEDKEGKVSWPQLDQFGFIGIEYAKAIENEFCRKIIIDYFKNYDEPIQDNDLNFLIIKNPQKKSKFPTIGDIARLLKSIGRGTINNKFASFLQGKPIGRYEDHLYKINDQYRIPAAHPHDYPVDTLKGFQTLLIEKGFLREFFGDIQ